MMNDDSYLVAKSMIKTKRRIGTLCAWWVTCLGVLVPLALLQAFLAKQGHAFFLLDMAIALLFFGWLLSFVLFVLFLVGGVFDGIFSCPWQTRDLRRNLLPPMPGKVDSSRGAELMAKRKRARDWIGQSFVASCGRRLLIVIVRLPRFVEDEISMEQSLKRVADRLARSNGAHYGAWEDLVIGKRNPKYYKFVVLRK